MNVNEINEQIQRHIAFNFDHFICFFKTQFTVIAQSLNTKP